MVNDMLWATSSIPRDMLLNISDPLKERSAFKIRVGIKVCCFVAHCSDRCVLVALMLSLAMSATTLC